MKRGKLYTIVLHCTGWLVFFSLLFILIISQSLEGNTPSFTAFKENDGRANSLHYKDGFAIGGLAEWIDNKIPFLENALGHPLVFDTYKFEVIESDITNKLLHKVAVHYITGWFTLYKIMGEALLLSKEIDLRAGYHNPADTFMLKMQPGLSITQYQEWDRFKQD